QVEYTYEIRSGKSKSSASGVRMMRMDDYDTAMQQFKLAMQEDPEDYRTLFCMGVTSEMKGDPEAALTYYKQALGMPGISKDDMPQIEAAKERLTQQKDRIRKKTTKTA